MQFAQIDDYYLFTTGAHAPADLPDAEVARLNMVLQRSTTSVRNKIRQAFIGWDEQTGFPTVPVVAAGLRDATCAQAAWFEAQGDLTGASAAYTNVSMGPVTIARNRTAGAVVTAADSRMAPEVMDILAGLPIWSPGVSHPGQWNRYGVI